MRKIIAFMVTMCLLFSMAIPAVTASAEDTVFGSDDITVRFSSGLIIRLLNFGDVSCDPSLFEVLDNSVAAHYTLDYFISGFTFQKLLAFAGGEASPTANELVGASETIRPEEIPSTSFITSLGKQYTDGATWVGGLDERGYATGWGTLTAANGYVSEVQMWHDLKHGFGRTYYPGGTKLYYSGFYKYDYPSELGTIFFEDGAYFSGYLDNGNPIYGKLYWPNGVLYTGLFSKDIFAERAGYGVEENLNNGRKIEAYWDDTDYSKLNVTDAGHAESIVTAAYYAANMDPWQESVNLWVQSRGVAWKSYADVLSGHVKWISEHSLPTLDENTVRLELIRLYQRLFGFVAESCVIDFQVTQCMLGNTDIETIESELRRGGYLPQAR